MALEGLRENLKERWTELLATVQESSAFNTAREKFESQTPTIQKAIVVGGALLAVVFLLSFPLGYLSTSGDNMALFEENRSLIQGLLRASRSAKEAPPLPPPMDGGMLRTMLDQMLRGKKLTTEQLGEMQAIPGKPSKFAPDMVVQNGIVAQIKQLNFTQIIDITNSVNNMAHGTKLVGLDIVQSIGQSHYYDLNIRVVNFGLPPLNMDLGGGDTKGGPKGRPKGGRPGSGSGGTTGSGGTPKMEGDE